MTLTRRGLLKNLAVLGLCYSGIKLPCAAAQIPGHLLRKKSKSKILVVIQLKGGNDGLNTVVPYEDGLYHQARPSLAVSAGDVLKVNNQIGFHPAMTGMHELFKSGRLAIIQAVGYPSHNRSHARSMEIWQTAYPDSIAETGWLGRYIDHAYNDDRDFVPGLSADPDLSKMLHGSGWNIPCDFGIRAFAKDDCRIISSYPQGAFGKDLRSVAGMIRSGLNCPIYGITLDGFDTHCNQSYQHGRLLEELSCGLTALYGDLRSSNLENDVLIFVFSEFGRRLAENSSGGTDHGTSGPVFLLGGAVKGGVYGDHAVLSGLENSELAYKIDFRSVYATILSGWFEIDSKAVLSQRFSDLGFIAKS